MERWSEKVALVTGASVGIGAETALLLAKHGMQVVACARNIDMLQQVASKCSGPGAVHARKCDVTKDDELAELFEFIRTSFKTLHVCVCNAGLAHDVPILAPRDGDALPLHEATAKWRNMCDVNVVSVAACIRLAVQAMEAAGVDDGQLIVVSSMAGHRIPGSTSVHFYSATKHAATAIVEATRRELRARGSRIRISGVSPGLVETDFAFRLHHENKERATQSYASMKALQAEDLAAVVVGVLSHPPHVEINDVLVRPVEQQG